jgi:hypothetical protein
VRATQILELRIDPLSSALRGEAEFRRLAAQIGVRTAIPEFFERATFVGYK